MNYYTILGRLNMPLDIITIEHSEHFEVLTQPANPVTFPLSLEVQALIDAMKAKLLTLKGVGLAAPQVGVNKQIIVFTISEEAKSLRNDANEVIPMTVLINPQYAATVDATLVHDWEACFSVTQIMGKVPRYNKISYTAQTPEGKKIKAYAQGFTARVLQHEIDHVHGFLITNRLDASCVQGHPKDMQAQRYQDLSPSQIEIVKKLTAEQEKNQ